MTPLIAQLAKYAAYHRDRRNIATHFVGIPMIVVATSVLLSRPFLPLGGLALSPALLVTVGSIAFYLRLDRRYALLMSGFLGASLWIGARLASEPTNLWLGAGVGLFVLGWIIQFVGHIFEGKKPAFVDDLVGLLVGPLFIVAEAGFVLRMRLEVKDAIEAQVGPTLIRSAGAVTA